MYDKNLDDTAANRDPITGAPGAHPVGTGIGAAGGAATGAAIGAVVGGPIGAAIGVTVGGIAGGLAGKGAAELADPTVEDTYWRQHYVNRPYVKPGSAYDVYQPAYRYGWEARNRYTGKSFDEVESDLAQTWPDSRGNSSLAWTDAREATRDAWYRVDRPSLT